MARSMSLYLVNAEAGARERAQRAAAIADDLTRVAAGQLGNDDVGLLSNLALLGRDATAYLLALKR